MQANKDVNQWPFPMYLGVEGQGATAPPPLRMSGFRGERVACSVLLGSKEGLFRMGILKKPGVTADCENGVAPALLWIGPKLHLIQYVWLLTVASWCCRSIL